MGGSGDAAEFGGSRTHRHRVPKPAQPSRIPNDAGSADRLTAEPRGGPSRVSALLAPQPRTYPAQRLFDVARRSGEGEPDERAAALWIEVDPGCYRNACVAQQL